MCTHTFAYVYVICVHVYSYLSICLIHEFIVNIIIIIIIHVLASPRIWEQPQFIAMFSHSSHELWSSVMLYKVLGIGMKKHMEKNTYRSPFPPWKRNYSNCKNKAFISMYFPFELPEKLWSSIVFLLSKKNSGYCILGKKCKIEKKNNDSWIQNHARNWCVWKSHFLKMMVLSHIFRQRQVYSRWITYP